MAGPGILSNLEILIRPGANDAGRSDNMGKERWQQHHLGSDRRRQVKHGQQPDDRVERIKTTLNASANEFRRWQRRLRGHYDHGVTRTEEVEEPV